MRMPQLTEQRPEKIHALTSLRFFAALFVVLHHTTWTFFPSFSRQSILGRYIEIGNVSVSFFFFLSGYILAVVYLRRGGPVQTRDFLRARFARVYPLFLLTLVLDTPVLISERVATYGVKAAWLKTAVTFTGNLVMLQAWVGRLRGIDNPNWSLSAETFFYLSFPILGVALWKLRGARIWVTAALLYVGGQIVVFLAAPHVGDTYIYFLPLFHVPTFALGIVLARWQTLAQASVNAHRSKDSGKTLVATLALICLCIVVYWSPHIPEWHLFDGVLAPVFGCLIWAFSHSQWPPAKFLSASWMVVLGEASFGLYLFHLPVFHLFLAMGWTHSSLMFPVYLGISIGLSVLSFYYFETPLRRWILKRRHTHVKETMEMASDAQ